MQAIWESVLPHACVRDDDTFVGLGGESVTGTICLLKVRRAFGVELSYTVLLNQSLTFAEFAALVDARSAPRADAAT